MTDNRVLGERFKKLFFAAQHQLKTGALTDATETFAAAENAVPANWTLQRFLAKGRRGACLISLRRWEEALIVFDELLADPEKLELALRDNFAEEIAAAYWARPLCLANLGRLDEASAAMPAFIEEVGTGETPQQREKVAHMYIIQAEYAISVGDYDLAEKALNSAITHCKRFKEPGMARFLRSASGMKLTLRRNARKARRR